MLEMTIEAVRVSLMNYHRVVILKEKDSNRFLPIWIGAPEADAIAVKQQGVPVPRPMTHDLLHQIITELGCKVVRIVVSDISNDTFYARIHLEIDGRALEIDSRPSDAINVAVRADAPIFCEEAVLDQAAVQMDEDGGLLDGTAEIERPPAVREEELEGMSAFRDFIDSLDLDDFGDK
ncbi:MAG: bifunctional nuclease family protein [Dehalococcoidia bacterium]